MRIDEFIARTIEKEGDGRYTNNPKDSGGPTRWGITEAVARAYGYQGDMRDLPRETAESIYRQRYWEEPGFAAIEPISRVLAERLFDFGALAGQSTSAKHLQRALNVLNHNGEDYPDIRTDGRIGKLTVGSLRAYAERRGDGGLKVLLGMVAAQQSVYLLELAERRPKDEEFMYGWQLNRAIGAIL
jgi:lysozyme family protein